MGIRKECAGCPEAAVSRPMVLPENSAAVEVFTICRNQWRTGGNGAFALDGNFVWKVMADLGVADKTATFGRVDTLATHYLAAIRQRKKK